MVAASLGSAWGSTGGGKAAEELCFWQPGKKIQRFKSPLAAAIASPSVTSLSTEWEGASHLLCEFLVSLSTTFLTLRMWQQIPLGLEETSPCCQVTKMGSCWFTWRGRVALFLSQSWAVTAPVCPQCPWLIIRQQKVLSLFKENLSGQGASLSPRKGFMDICTFLLPVSYLPIHPSPLISWGPSIVSCEGGMWLSHSQKIQVLHSTQHRYHVL